MPRRQPIAIHAQGLISLIALKPSAHRLVHPKPYQPKTDTASGWADHTRSHAVADPEVFKLESLLTDPAPAKDEPVKKKQD